jgi:hypothetical protein
VLYKRAIDLLTAKLGIKDPMINRAEMYGNDHPQQSLFYKMGQIESQLTDRINNLQKEMNHKLEIKDLQIKHFMEMNELKCKFNILEAKEKLAPCNDNFCTRRENSKQDHPQPNQHYMLHLHRHKYHHMSSLRTQLYHHLCISNVLINTLKSSIQTRDKHKYSLNTTRLITTSDTQLILIVQQSCQQMGSIGIIKPNITTCHRSGQVISAKEQAIRTAKTEMVNIEH